MGRLIGSGWVAATVATLACAAGCQSNPGGTASTTDQAIRGDVTDIRPTGHAAVVPLESPAAFTETPSLIPIGPQAVTPASIPVVESPVQFAAAEATPATTAVAVKPAAVRTVAKAVAKPRAGRFAGTTHIVQRGETLFAIARAAYGDGTLWRKLAAANPAVNTKSLRVGQPIVVP